MIERLEPILNARDLQEAVRFYTETLGFKLGWQWGEPPRLAQLNWGRTALMIAHDPALAEQAEGLTLFCDVDRVDELYARHQAAGAPIASPLEAKPWGLDEYTVVDPNGYRLRFAGVLAKQQSTRPFPEIVVVEDRLPTREEYQSLHPAYKTAHVDRLIATSHLGVVALGPEGIVGMARAMFDAPGWYSVWDVQVADNWQGQHIGDRVMRRLLELIRAEAPTAYVFLFTFKHGFYEKMGFSTERVTFLRLGNQ